MPAATYGASTGPAPSGMLYLLSRNQVSSAELSSALSTTTSYSPTANWASIRTGALAPAEAALAAMDAAGGTAPNARLSNGGWQGLTSQYSTRRGAPSASTRANTSFGRTLTFSFCNTVGTGITS